MGERLPLALWCPPATTTDGTLVILAWHVYEVRGGCRTVECRLRIVVPDSGLISMTWGQPRAGDVTDALDATRTLLAL